MITVHIDSAMSEEEKAFKLAGALKRSDAVKLVMRQKLCDLGKPFVSAPSVYADGDELVVEVVLHAHLTYSEEAKKK